MKYVLRQVNDGETTLEVSQKLLCDKPSIKLEVIKRKVNPEQPAEPILAKSKPRAHRFYGSAAVTAYLGDYGGKNTVMLADPESGTIGIILDERAERGREVLYCEPILHPLCRPWAELINKKGGVDVKAFVSFLRDNRKAIVKPDSRDIIMAFSQVKASSSVEVFAGKGKSTLNCVMVKTTVQGQANETLVELPDKVSLFLPIYYCTKETSVELDLNVECPDTRSIVVSVSAADFAAVRYQAFEKLIGELKPIAEKLKCIVALGRVGQGEWETLEVKP